MHRLVARRVRLSQRRPSALQPLVLNLANMVLAHPESLAHTGRRHADPFARTGNTSPRRSNSAHVVSPATTAPR